MKIAIVSDAWHPQRNGVVRVLSNLRAELDHMGHQVVMLTPDRFSTVPCPTYPEIRLAVFPGLATARWLADQAPDAIHIATEGPLGWAARRWCVKHGRRFTTAYHTKFPQYVAVRTRVPIEWPIRLIRHFHRPSSGVMVPTPAILRELDGWNFENLRQWGHGVDCRTFRPRGKAALDHLPRPVFLYAGRVTVDKNLPAFLDLDLPGTKVIVGDGPSRPKLKAAYPQAHFLIANGDEELVGYFSGADVFVFPSLTDTFGLVMLESLACGVPVAAFPVPGPLDVIGKSAAGVLGTDLRQAALAALDIDPGVCRSHADGFQWRTVASRFADNLVPAVNGGPEPDLDKRTIHATR